MLTNYQLAIAFLPFWFRLAQCFRRYHETGVKAHLTNAGKYFSSLMIQFVYIFKTLYPDSNGAFICYVFICIFATSYSYYWDLYMDWGLFRSKEKGKYWLRPKLFYPSWFYYYAAVSNLIMRCFWILPLLSFTKVTWVANSSLITLV